MVAVAQHGHALRWADDSLVADKEVVLTAVRQVCARSHCRHS